MNRGFALGGLVAALVVLLANAESDNGGPSGAGSSAARVCERDGFRLLIRADGTSFAAEADCVAYVAGGGKLQSLPPTATVARTPAPPTPSPTARPLSEGCQLINAPGFDAQHSSAIVRGPFHAGERITISARAPVTLATPATFKFEFAEVEQEHPFPGTITFVVPDDGSASAVWWVSGGTVTWAIACTV